MARPTTVTINLNALKHNFSLTKRYTTSKIVGVIKANAYGHGAIKVAQTLQSENIDCLGVACIEEAIELKEAGILTPILLLEGFFTPDELVLITQHNLRTVIHCEEQVNTLLSCKINHPIHIWIKIDTGMHRLGVLPAAFKKIYHQLKACSAVASITLMTHFSMADRKCSDFTMKQTDLFNQTIASIIEPTSLSNSAGLLNWPLTHGDWVRPGLMLYGISPFINITDQSELKLKPVMSFTSKIIAIKNIIAGENIGYGDLFVAQKPKKIGVIAVGYGDGYNRKLPQGTHVMIHQKPAHLIGNISMDMSTVDLTDRPDVNIGDDVELWGEQVSVAELAQSIHTIAYELLCSVKRAKIVYC